MWQVACGALPAAGTSVQCIIYHLTEHSPRNGWSSESAHVQVHEAIREKPVKEKKERTAPAKKGTHWPGTPKKLTQLERKQALKQRLAQLMEDA
jgi:hypothetical protein